MKRSGITGNHQNVFCHFHSSFHQNQNNVKRSIRTRQTDLFGQDMLALFQKHELLNPDTLNPFFHSISGSSGLKPLSLHPFHRIRAQCMKVHSAGTNPAAMGGTERNNRLFGKIIAFQKRTDNPGGLPVPYCVSKLIQIFLGCYRFYIYFKCREINTFQKGRCTHARAAIVFLVGIAALSIFQRVKNNDSLFFRVAKIGRAHV